MRRLLYPVLAALLAVCFLSSAAQQAVYPKTLLWRISGKNLTKSSYLFGTMHLTDRRLFQFSDSLYHYLEQAEGFAMELDADEMVNALLQSLGKPDTSALLKNILDKAEFEKVARELEAHFGVPADRITKKQAWLYRQSYSNPKAKPDDMESFVDAYLYNIARRQGKWVGGIEDMEDQLSLIDELSDFDAGDLLLRKKEKDLLEKLIKVYTAQDINEINNLIATMKPEQRQALLTKRNIKMAYRIDSLAGVRSHFFAVGAAHLPGTDGLIELLRADGYTVDPVLSNKKVAPEQYTYKPIELPWHKQEEGDEYAYTAYMPGKAVAFTPDGVPMRMQVYVDLGTGFSYFITQFQVPFGKKIEDFYQHFSSSIKEKSKGVQSKNITFKGVTGLEMYRQEGDYFYRMRLLPTGNHIVMAMVGGQKKGMLTGAEAEKFFSMLELREPVVKPSTGWYTYADKEKAFKVAFPGTPVVNEQMNHNMKQQEGAEAWRFSNQTYLAPGGEMHYTLVVKETAPGYYITSDAEMFDNFRASIVSNDQIMITRYDTGRIKGHAGLWMDGAFKSSNLMLKSMHVNKGNRGFTLMVICERGTDISAVDSFFHSFEFTGYEAAAWQPQSNVASGYTTMAPAPFQRVTEEGDESTLFTYDKGSGHFMQVQAEPIPAYFWVSSDSAYFRHKLNEYMGGEDSIAYERKVVNGAVPAMEFGIWMGAERRNFKRLRMLLHNDSSYVLSMIAPEDMATSVAFDPFFSEFRFHNYKRSNRHLENKTAKLLAQLQSKDSLLFEEAQMGVNDAPFTKEDLPLLHPALLEPYADFDESGYCTHDVLIEVVTAFQDASTVSFIQQHYASLAGEKENLKYPLLRTLAGIKTEAAYDVLKKLLLQQPPGGGTPSGLASSIVSSGKLAQVLFPEALKQKNNEALEDVWTIVANNLADSGWLQLQELMPYKEALRTQAAARFEAHRSTNSNANWALYSSIYLLGKFNDAASHALLQQMLKSHELDVVREVVEMLLKNGQAVDVKTIEKVAADRYHRLGFYSFLKEKGKLALFPAKYATQQSLTESELFIYSSDDVAPSKITFIGERTGLYKGEKKKFFLYKVTYEGEDGSEEYLAIAGAYELTGKKIVLESEVMGFAEELYNPKTIDAQFKKYLEGLEP